jgi:hypothetical protein
MENPNLDPNTIIDALGGTGAVASLCAVSDAAVSQWRSRGFIPPVQLRYLRLRKPKIFKRLDAEVAEAKNECSEAQQVSPEAPDVSES